MRSCSECKKEEKSGERFELHRTVTTHQNCRIYVRIYVLGWFCSLKCFNRYDNNECELYLETKKRDAVLTGDYDDIGCSYCNEISGFTIREHFINMYCKKRKTLFFITYFNIYKNQHLYTKEQLKQIKSLLP